MKLIIKVGCVFKTGEWGGDTYFEEEKEFEREVNSLDEAITMLRDKYLEIYDIKTEIDGTIVAIVSCVC